MMEEDFCERLKKYRKERNLTQQELADLLGVSNKTVSRWESAGGYPDISVLVPLARALGVTADDLLDEKKPVRALTRTDWQNLLSYFFAIGGGILFYLLKLFVPVIVCYLVYLGCLAYGVYLQRYYSYHSRWFRLGWLVMNFCVNVSLLVSALSLPAVLGWGQTALAYAGGLMGNNGYGWRLLVPAVTVVLALAGGLTAITLWAAAHCAGGERDLLRLRLGRPRAERLFPSIGALLLTAFWGVYLAPGLGVWWYDWQRQLYVGLLTALLLVCLPLYGRRGHRGGLWVMGLMVAGGLCLPLFAQRYARLFSGVIRLYTPELSHLYQRFGALSPALAVGGLILCALCVLAACVYVERPAKSPPPRLDRGGVREQERMAGGG